MPRGHQKKRRRKGRVEEPQPLSAEDQATVGKVEETQSQPGQVAGQAGTSHGADLVEAWNVAGPSSANQTPAPRQVPVAAVSPRRQETEEFDDDTEYSSRAEALLYEGLQREDIYMVRRAVEAGADVNARHEYTFPLLVAATTGCTEVVSFLLDTGAVINMVDDCDRTSLQVACKMENWPVVKLLLERGAAVDVRDFPDTISGRKKQREISRANYKLKEAGLPFNDSFIIDNEHSDNVLEELKKIKNSLVPDTDFSLHLMLDGNRFIEPYFLVNGELRKKIETYLYSPEMPSKFPEYHNILKYVLGEMTTRIGLLEEVTKLSVWKCGDVKLDVFSIRNILRYLSTDDLRKFLASARDQC